MKYSKDLVLALAALGVASLACSLTVDIPVDRINPGPTQVEKVEVLAPAADEINLALVFGAGEFYLVPGAAAPYLVQGEASYNVDDFAPKLNVDGGDVKLETGSLKLTGVPDLSGKVENTWTLALGDQAMNLDINAGAYKGEFDLGGLALRNLNISDGAADVRLDFSEPNRLEMDRLQYVTGASSVRLKHLGNANFAEMIFKSGAGDYNLDFTGQWQRDATVKIDSGISSLTITAPTDLNVMVVMKGGLTNVNMDSGWVKSGQTYMLSGSGPTLTIIINMGAGSIDLRTR